MNKSKLKNSLVLVLGMHRSGTSVVTRGLKVLGVELGAKALELGDDNKKGFWEDSDFKKLNMEMLEAVNHDWDSIEHITSADVNTLLSKGFLEKATVLIRRKTKDSKVFGLKDPRASILLTFWMVVFERLNLDVNYVIAVRNPRSVVKSLSTRSNMDRTKAYLLWLDYTITALHYTREKRRIVIDYDHLLFSPEHELTRLAKTMSLKIDPIELEVFKGTFLDNELRHAEYSLDDLSEDPECTELVSEVANVLLRLSEDQIQINQPKILKTIDEWNDGWSKLASIYESTKQVYRKERQIHKSERQALIDEKQALIVQKQELMIQKQALTDEKQVLRSEVAKATAKADALQFELTKNMLELNTVYGSISWRVTNPARLMSGYGRKFYRELPLPSKVRKGVRGLYNKFIYAGNVKDQTDSKPNIHIADQESAPDYIIWGVIDWHFRTQRPQHLAKAFSQLGRRVFYVSSNIMPAEVAGFNVEPLDSSGRLFQLNLYAKGAPSIYSDELSEESISQLTESIGEVLEWTGSKQVISLVDHPCWYSIARVIPSSRMVFDCMDHHEGFGDSSAGLLNLEKKLIEESEHTITTSLWLDRKIKTSSKRSHLVRNAGDYKHFSTVPSVAYADALGRKVIGYYGAIAGWFDVELIELVAKHNPDCCVLLIGADTVGVQRQLSKLANVNFVGEVPYSELPYYLYGFDVCLLPFKIEPLTLATNPVKIYEYFCASKPVVAVDLPEVVQFGDLLYIAKGHQEFIDAVDYVLNTKEDQTLIQKRGQFAKQQTWGHRAEELITLVESSEFDSMVSIIVVTYNNLHLTQQCLASLDEYSGYQNIEIIVVDNNSQDESQSYLSEWVKKKDNRKLILNDSNRGFSAANNQGLVVAKGDYLVLLNNDTHVTSGWVRTMMMHLKRDPSVGLIGPITNNIGNEAKIKIEYENMGEMLSKSSSYCRKHIGKVFPLKTVAFFCVMMSRATFEDVGPLDEAFGQGFFEDDDYCRRVEALGLGVCCAEDVFIHHELSASFDKLKKQDRRKLFEHNKKVYEAKWGKWVPHRLREEI